MTKEDLDKIKEAVEILESYNIPLRPIQLLNQILDKYDTSLSLFGCNMIKPTYDGEKRLIKLSIKSLELDTSITKYYKYYDDLFKIECTYIFEGSNINIDVYLILAESEEEYIKHIESIKNQIAEK